MFAKFRSYRSWLPAVVTRNSKSLIRASDQTLAGGAGLLLRQSDDDRKPLTDLHATGRQHVRPSNDVLRPAERFAQVERLAVQLDGIEIQIAHQVGAQVVESSGQVGRVGRRPRDGLLPSFNRTIQVSETPARPISPQKRPTRVVPNGELESLVGAAECV